MTTRVATIRFNGAGDLHHRKAGLHLHRHAPVARFNGAGDLHHRKEVLFDSGLIAPEASTEPVIFITGKFLTEIAAAQAEPRLQRSR